MKKSICGIAIPVVLVLAALAPCAYSEESWTTYVNARFGYSTEYPDIFSKTEEPDNGDGVWMESGDGNYRLTLSGGYNVLGEDGQASLASRLEEVSHIVGDSAVSGDGWYRVIYSDDGGRDGSEHLFHEYGIINADNWTSFILVYPLDERARFAPIAERMEASLALPPSSGEEGGGPNFDAFSLKNGHVYKNEKELDCEVYEVPKGIDSAIKTWAVVGTETSEVVKEEETGVWFFGSGGGFMAFIPLESEREYQDIFWSGAGDRLLLQRGSPMRPDVFFELYAEGMEKKAEFPGVRDGIAWLSDGMRFAFTRIGGDIREEGKFFNLAYGLRLSAVLYDSAVGETIVLKEATDTQNFWFASVSEDDENIAVTEEYVESPKDWADEEKIKQREITVPVPPAG
jgi:hypothetical protein